MPMLKLELKNDRKALLIWSLAVGLMGMMCIFLYQSIEADMAKIADSFASMGAFSDAIGMSTISIATVEGYFATEIGMMQALGSGMFAACLGIVLFSKEEDGHTAEFLYTLPRSRVNIAVCKYAAMLAELFLFHLICWALYAVSLVAVAEDFPMDTLAGFMALQFLLSVEIAAICSAVSAAMRKNKLGLGFGVMFALYVFDMMARIFPDLKDFIFLGPYAYANGAELFAGNGVDAKAIIVGAIVIAVSVLCAVTIYGKRDLSV